MKKWIFIVFAVYMTITLGIVLAAQLLLSDRHYRGQMEQYMNQELRQLMAKLDLGTIPVEVNDTTAINIIRDGQMVYFAKTENGLEQLFSNDIIQEYMRQQELYWDLDRKVILNLLNDNTQPDHPNIHVYYAPKDSNQYYIRELDVETKSGESFTVIAIMPFYFTNGFTSNIVITLVIPVVIGMIISLVIIFILASGINRSLNTLIVQTKKMVALNFKPMEKKIKGYPEIIILQDALNLLAAQLNEAMEELNDSNKQLSKELVIKEEREEMLQQFLSDVSHELKTPITIIQGHAEALLDEVGDAYYYYSSIAEEAERMKIMVKNLLAYIREQSQIDLNGEVTNINLIEVIDEQVNRYKTLLDKTGQEVKVKGGQNVFIKGRYILVESVIKNLLDNAIHHGLKDETIKVKVEEKRSGIEVEIYNRCQPLSTKELKKIWLPFYKTDLSRQRVDNGTGLGLAIVKRIIESQGGKVDASYEDGGLRMNILLTNRD